MKKIKFLILGTVIFIYSQSLLLAQSNNAKTALDTATTNIKGLFSSAINLLYGVAAIIAIVGAIKVYIKWQHDDPNILKTVAGWFGSAIFIALVGVILKAVFGV